MLEIKTVPMEFPADANIIVGQAHFIKLCRGLFTSTMHSMQSTSRLSVIDSHREHNPHFLNRVPS
jgi:adenosine/AMP kinase